MQYLFELIPSGMSVASATLLIGTSFFTSMLTASVGIGGGTVLLAVMAQLIPAKAIVPVHGVVQLGSNTGRALIMRKDVNLRFLAFFFLGCGLGALAGGQIVVALPTDILRLILGLFILTSVWAGSMFPTRSIGRKSIVLGGGITTLLSMFVGATGPLVITMVKQMQLSAIALVATSAASLVIQHTFKLVIFGFLGFAFAPYIPLLAAMIITGFFGTIIGKQILIKTPPANFKRALNLLISLLAIRLIYESLKNLFF